MSTRANIRAHATRRRHHAKAFHQKSEKSLALRTFCEST